jgi:dUTP pyrophosphatase
MAQVRKVVSAQTQTAISWLRWWGFAFSIAPPCGRTVLTVFRSQLLFLPSRPIFLQLSQPNSSPRMSAPVRVHITRLTSATRDVPLPSYATEHSAGMDICAAVETDLVLKAGETSLIPTGFAIALPDGYEAQVRPRSGLAITHQVGILNSPGTIDSDYRGEVKIILTNFGKKDFVVRRGDRIAQLVIAPYARAEWEERDALDETRRGSGGFGHTGV